MRHLNSFNYFCLGNKSFTCQHNTRSKSTSWKKDKRCKSTNCTFSLSVKLLSTTSHHIKQFPDQKCQIKFENIHNHHVSTLQALNYRDILETMKEKVCQLFSANYTPAIALTKMRNDLRDATESKADYEL